MTSYIAVAFLGACLAVAYWTLINRVYLEVLSPQRNDTPAIASQGQVATSPSPKQVPSLKFEAHIEPTDPPFLKGASPGGISWKPLNGYVRLNITNGQVPIRDLDFKVTLDRGISPMSIVEIAQISRIPNTTWFPAIKEDPGLAVVFQDKDGNPGRIGGAITMAPIYRVHSAALYGNSNLEIIIAVLARTANLEVGKPYAEKRAPRRIELRGTYETSGVDGVQRYPFEYSYDFTP